MNAGDVGKGYGVWVPVGDKIPGKSQRVIAIKNTKLMQIVTWQRSDKNFFTHWMPLPEAPLDNLNNTK